MFKIDDKDTDDVMILKNIVSIGLGIHFRNIRMCFLWKFYASMSNCPVNIIFSLKKQFVRVV